MVNVFYFVRGEHPEMQHVEVQTTSYRDAAALIDRYPWRKEVMLFEENGEGGGLFFIAGDEGGKHAYFQLIPIEPDKGLLCFWLVLEKGFLGIFGKKRSIRRMKKCRFPKRNRKLNRFWITPLNNSTKAINKRNASCFKL